MPQNRIGACFLWVLFCFGSSLVPGAIGPSRGHSHWIATLMDCGRVVHYSLERMTALSFREHKQLTKVQSKRNLGWNAKTKRVLDLSGTIVVTTQLMNGSCSLLAKAGW